ncbi:hypothetical protein DH2020_004405 [Rehmannia glutinosa]|uniref:MPN domain-containing protein n=1 Tax=Rehmannia glutinosa TaxID=99300 RepID=A0ABR0XQ26_REHGL
MRRPAYSSPSINFSAMTRKIDVDNRISLRNYYRIADNLLKQLMKYQVILLHVMLLQKLLAVLDELETLKPKVRRQLDELEKVNTATPMHQFDGPNKISYASSLNNKSSLIYSNKQMLQPITAPSSSLKQNNEHTRFSSSSSVESQFQKLSLSLPLPKQETLSRHSFLGPNGLRGQWLGPSAEIKVNYPTNIVMDSSEISSLNQVGQPELVATTDNDSKVEKSTMESVLSLDDGSWLAEESGLPQGNGMENNNFQLGNIRQPSPPPVLAQVQPELLPISPTRVADPRPGPPKFSEDGLPSSNSYQDLHIPVKIMEDFLRLARQNTAKNLETCGVLAGSLRNRVFHITTLIIPKQESTSDSCQTLNEEEIFEVQDKRSLFPLGWIHVSVTLDQLTRLSVISAHFIATHPTQTCFMSSVDLHTHYSYQVMLPEAIAIVMAPTDTSSPHGIFHLSDPSGVSIIRNCQQRGFHPHEEPDDGTPIYEHCSHVYMNSNLKFDVVDLRYLSQFCE